MSHPLPVSNFRWLTQDQIEKLDYTKLKDNGEKGYIFEVDLEYPEKLHDLHNDYPLAPEKIKVSNDMLSLYTRDLKNTFAVGNSTTEKLIPTLNNKTKYVIHYRNLKQCLELGLKVTKIHRVIEFTQKPWLKEYIAFNTEMRKKSKNNFEKDFYKLMNNSVFGKTMENLRNRIKVRLCKSVKIRNKLVASPNFKSMRIFNENLVGIHMQKTKIKLNKPIYCGFTILDNSKQLMYDFHYNYIKKKYKNNSKLLFTDTDSLCYEIKTKDIYKELFTDKHLFDNSDYPKDCKFYDDTNKKVLGKFKDETSFDPLIEFVGLRSKMYSYKTESSEHKKAKGIKKNVVGINNGNVIVQNLLILLLQSIIEASITVF